MDVGEVVPALVGSHPLVDSIRLTGSRSAGTQHELSDWDFLVATHDFAPLAAELPRLIEPLQPLAGQWDRYSHHACYMVMLRGPLKVDLIFPGQEQEWAPAWEPSQETLAAIDAHFWDWILWLEQKRRAGEEKVLDASLVDMYKLMLEPMGACSRPDSVAEAVELFVDLRHRLEDRFGVRVSRELEQEVRPLVAASSIERRFGS